MEQMELKHFLLHLTGPTTQEPHLHHCPTHKAIRPLTRELQMLWLLAPQLEHRTPKPSPAPLQPQEQQTTAPGLLTITQVTSTWTPVYRNRM